MIGLLFAFVDGDRTTSDSANEMRLFQRTVGGLGMGAAAAPSWGILYYDPRIQPVDDSGLWPVPGIYPFNPSAASSVVAFKEIPRNDLAITKIE